MAKEPKRTTPRMGLMVCTNLFRTSANDSFGRVRLARKKGNEFLRKSTKPIPKSHLNRYVSAFRKFVEIPGVPYLDESDFKMIDLEAKDWESIYQCPWKQAGEIPPRVLKAWGGFVSDSSLCVAVRLFAWSFRVAVAGLRWDDLLSTAPATTVLMKECLIGFAAKTKTGGKSEEGLGISLFLTKTGSQMGFSYSEKTRGGGEPLPRFLDWSAVGLRIRIRIL